MSKATEGPWFYNADFGEVQAKAGTVLIARRINQEMHDLGAPPKQAEANGRLLAAAPDLLEAAKASAALCQRFQSEEETIILPEEFADVLELLRRALAKARGAIEEPAP